VADQVKSGDVHPGAIYASPHGTGSGEAPPPPPPPRRDGWGILEKALATIAGVLAVVAGVLGIWGVRQQAETKELEGDKQAVTNQRDDLSDELRAAEDEIASLQEQLAAATSTTTTVKAADDPTSDPNDPISGSGTFLDELDPVDYGGSSTDGIYARETASSNGVTYTHALVGSAGCQSTAESWVDYDLSRDYTRFTTTVGLSDSSSAESAVSFTIYLDNEPIAEGDLRLGSSVPVDVDVTDGLRMRLEMVDPNAPNQSCGFENIESWIVFGDPKLVR
jgi:hypothetical protein